MTVTVLPDGNSRTIPLSVVGPERRLLLRRIEDSCPDAAAGTTQTSRNERIHLTLPPRTTGNLNSTAMDGCHHRVTRFHYVVRARARSTILPIMSVYE